MSNAIVQRQTVAPLEFSPEQRQMVLNTFLNGASEQEASVLMEIARVRHLNPITRQIHFVKRWDSEKKAFVWAAQVGIDGFRAIAERTGLYDGQDEPEFQYAKDGSLLVCRVKVFRKDWTRPAVGVAHFKEYAQTFKDKQTGQFRLTQMWASKPHIMLAKCAEALAFRKAFPEDLSGLYAPEEMPEQTPRSEPVETGSRRTAELKAALKRNLGVEDAQVVEAPKLEVVQDEPPPPSDDDAPPPDEPEEAVVVPTVPFGKKKGTPISQLSVRDLAWYADAARKELADPSKQRFHGGTAHWLAVVEAEQRARAQ